MSFALALMIRPLHRSGRLSPRFPRRYAPPGSPFGLRRAAANLKKADRRGLAPVALLPTRRETESPNDRARRNRASIKAHYVSPRLVVDATGGPLAHLVSKIDDLGFLALHAWRDGKAHRDYVAMIRSYFRFAGMFSPWIQRTMGLIVSRWLTAIRRAQCVCRMLDDNCVIDLICREYHL